MKYVKAPFLAPRYRKGAFMYFGVAAGADGAKVAIRKSVKASFTTFRVGKEAFTDFGHSRGRAVLKGPFRTYLGSPPPTQDEPKGTFPRTDAGYGGDAPQG
ncbi:hypothetical protein ACFWMR_42290, partial [Amycolatopsis thailandensis]|uniref:hypothetical protein n=1 Tax=Amycolatopsis thailandensis TaxID=589330 RepID=UPI0036512282